MFGCRKIRRDIMDIEAVTTFFIRSIQQNWLEKESF